MACAMYAKRHPCDTIFRSYHRTNRDIAQYLTRYGNRLDDHKRKMRFLFEREIDPSLRGPLSDGKLVGISTMGCVRFIGRIPRNFFGHMMGKSKQFLKLLQDTWTSRIVTSHGAPCPKKEPSSGAYMEERPLGSRFQFHFVSGGLTSRAKEGSGNHLHLPYPS